MHHSPTMQPLLVTTKCAAIVALVLTIVDHAASQRYQRLLQPSTGSKLTMTPGVKTPNVQLNTIESFFTMKMPVSVRFPTVAESFSTFMVTAMNRTLPVANKAEEKLEESVPKSRSFSSRVLSRLNFYETIEKSHRTFGKSCLLRAMCEVAEVPFLSSSTGLLGEMLDLLLT